MKHLPVDPVIAKIIQDSHSDLPDLSVEDLYAIYDLMISEDNEIKLTGVNMLDTCNYFKYPKTVQQLYCLTSITGEIDTLDIFAGMIRTMYVLENPSSDEDLNLLEKLKEYAGINK